MFNDTDLFLINDGTKTETVTVAQMKQEFGGGGGSTPIDPTPGDGNTAIFPGVSGTGSEVDPFVLTAKEVVYGGTTTTDETITFSNFTEGDTVQFIDTRADTNGTRFTQPAGAVGADGTWSGTLTFTDTPESSADTDFEGLLKIGDVYFKWVVTAQAAVALATPSVATPPNGAGIGGDLNYFPETSDVTTVGTTPAGGLANSIDNSLDWQEVDYCGNKWIGLSQNGATRIMYSTDGVSWTACNGPGATATISWEKVAYGNGKYVAVGYGNGGNFIAYSSDGIGWSLSDTSGIESTVRPRSVCYDDFRDRFWFVADQGSKRGGYSTDGGLTWTATTIGSDSAIFYDIQRGPDGLLAVQKEYSYYYADDDTRWRNTNGLPASNTFYSVVYAQDKWRMLSGNQVWESEDGINWSRNGTCALNGQQRDIAFGNGVYIAVTNSEAPGIQYSYNGVNWFAANNEDPSQEFFCCGYGNGKFVALGRDTGVSGKAVNYSLTGDDWSGTLTSITLTNDKAYNSADGSQVTTVDEVFKAGDKVVGQGGPYVPPVSLQGPLKYTGTSANLAVSTGVDHTQGGVSAFTWIKALDNSDPGYSFGTWRSSANESVPLQGNDAVSTVFTGNSFTATGLFVGGGQTGISSNGTNYAAWSFRTNKEFIDCVKYDGDGQGNRAIPHNLGTDVGFIVIKSDDTNTNSNEYICYHHELGTKKQWGFKTLNATSNSNYYPTAPTDKVFFPGAYPNGSSYTNYVAHIFAKDVPGVIKCGRYTGTGNTGVNTIEVGFQPQWVLIKSNSSGGWCVIDDNRTAHIAINASNQEDSSGAFVGFTSTGFQVQKAGSDLNSQGNSFYYVAIAKSVNTGLFSTSGTLVADAAGTSLTLKDTTGEWVAGMKAVSQTEYTQEAPGADDIVFTSDKPATTAGTVTTWGNAEWQLATDSNFVDKQDRTVALQNVETEQGPADFTVEGNTEYWVRTRYTSTDPVAVSDWSDANRFKTAEQLQDGWFPVNGALTKDGNWYDICFGDGKFVAVGKNRSAVSTDGVNWTQYNDIIPGDTSKDWKGVTFANGKFWAVGDYDAISSNDGASWTQDASHQAYKSHAIAGDGSSNLVVVGEYYNAIADKQFSYSTNNGSTWQTYGKDSAVWYYIAHGNGVFMIGGTGGNASISTAGNSWANKKTQSGGSLKDVIFADGKFVLPDYGSSGTQVTWTEDNGTTWDGSNGLGNGEYWNAIAYGDGRYVCVGNASQANQIMWSDDLQTWTGVTAPAAEDLIKVTWGNGVFVAMYNNIPSINAQFIYSESGRGYSARSLFYDEAASRPVTDSELVRRYGVDPETTDLRSHGIYPLTEQPVGEVQGYVKEGNAYKPIEDQTQRVLQLECEVAEAQSRAAQLEDDLLKRVEALEAASEE